MSQFSATSNASNMSIFDCKKAGKKVCGVCLTYFPTETASRTKGSAYSTTRNLTWTICPVHRDQFREHATDLVATFAQAPSEPDGIVPSALETGETHVYTREHAELLKGALDTAKVCEVWASAELNGGTVEP